MEQNNNPDKFPVFNLLEGSAKCNPEYREMFAAWRKKVTFHNFSDTNAELGLKTGDIVTFISGYNSDLKYTTEILGFDANDGKAFMLWDCYWFPVDLNERKFVKA